MKRVILTLIATLSTSLSFAQNLTVPLWENDPPNYRETGDPDPFGRRSGGSSGKQPGELQSAYR